MTSLYRILLSMLMAFRKASLISLGTELGMSMELGLGQA